MYIRFGKVFHFLTIVIFLFTFLYIYSALSNSVAYEVDETGNFLASLNKDTLFFTGLGIFILGNFLILIPAKLIENKSTPKLKKIFPVGDPFREYLLTWFYSFAGIINISLALLAFFILRINFQEEINANQFTLFYYMVPVLLLLWIGALFWIFVQKVNSLKSNS
jgi:hypothetical protein